MAHDRWVTSEDVMKKNVSELQKQLQNAYKRIAELIEENERLKKQNESV